MDYEWDDPKRLSNLGKHGVDFDAMHRFQWETAIIDPDDRHDEPRWVARGFIGAVLYVATFTERGGKTRVISLRKANAREKREYVRDRSS